MEDIELKDTVEPQLVGAGRGSSGQLRQRSRDREEEDQGYHDDLPDEGNYVDQQLLSDTEKMWAKGLIFSCLADIVGSGVIVSVSFKYAYRDNGVSLYSMGFQGISHWLSSLLLILRFAGELKQTASADQGLIRRNRRKQLHREQALSITMAIVMLISSCALLFKAFRKLKFWDKWYLDHRDYDKEAEEATEWLAWTGFAIYILQAIFRIVCACKLSIGMVSHACVASVVSLVFLGVLGFAASYEKEWSWKAEPIAAIGLVFVTLIEGIRIIFNYLDDMDTRLKYDPRGG